jgi:DNA-binding transcriptional LysR family regulator
MDINFLKVFCDLVEQKSFTKASAINFLSQSAVSQQLNKIEDEAKISLIERGRKNFVITHAGKLFYNEAKLIFSKYKELLNNINSLSGKIIGDLKVGSTYSIGLHELPELIKKYLKLYPQVNLNLEYLKAAEIYKAVLNDSLDLGFVAYPDKKNGLEILDFRQDELVLITHPQNSLVKHLKLPFGQLHNQRFIAFEKEAPTRKKTDEILKRNNIKVNIIMEFDNIELVKRAVEIDAGVAIVPEKTVETEVKVKTLKKIKFSDQNLTRPIGALFKKKKKLSLPLVKFLELLKEVVSH